MATTSQHLDLDLEALDKSELIALLRAALEKLAEYEQELAQLRKQVMGRTSEKRSRTARSEDEKPKRAPNDKDAQKKRKARREAKAELPCEVIEHPVETPEDVEPGTCERCGGSLDELAPETSVEFEYVPGHFVRKEHRRQTCRCAACNHFMRAPLPPRVWEQARYGPALVAHAIVSKCDDCIPHNRLAKRFEREGVPMARSTLTDLFHRGLGLLKPIVDEMFRILPEHRVVYADETSLKMQKVEKLGYVWTFSCETCIVYTYSTNRSGDTPKAVLGDSTGVLVVDGYTGYNHVTAPERRTRGGCNPHARRKFVDIEHPIAEQIIEAYQGVFAVEREAKERGEYGSAEHFAQRQLRSRPAMKRIKALAKEGKASARPKSPLGQACGYIINQYTYLTLFLSDSEVAPDNNVSERLLRTIAMGRRNYLFVGHEEAAESLTIGCSLIQTCKLHEVNPQDYLTDVLMRVQHHPQSRIHELLPHQWKELFGPRPP